MEDLSDNERAEQLRTWWLENWLWIFGSIAIGLGAIAAWQYWQRSQLQASELDQASYLSVLETLDANDRATAAKKADDLRSLHPKSVYADQADLALARGALDARDFDVAAKRLRVVMDSSRDPELRLIARTRLARVLGEQGKHDEALALLGLEAAGAFAPLFHEIRGDVLAAKGDAAGARREYDLALAPGASAEGPALDTQYIELKRDALASLPPPSTPAAAEATPAPGVPTAPSPAAIPATGSQP